MATPSTEHKPKKTPRVRQNGLCYVCRKERPPIAVKIGDPFCSTACSRSYFKTEEHSGS